MISVELENNVPMKATRGYHEEVETCINETPTLAKQHKVIIMTKPHKVVITDFITDELEPERDVLHDIAEVVSLDAHSEQDVVGRIEDADAVIIYHLLTLRKQTIERLKRCRIIVASGVGFDNVDHLYARQRNIAVANVPDYGTEEVADTAIGMMLSLTRGISYLNSYLRSDTSDWSHYSATPVHRLRGRALGIVGFGRIGTAVGLRAKALGMDVIFYDPYVPDGRDKSIGVTRADSLEQLLPDAHALSLHCPLTAETRHMIDAEAISRMPQGAYLVNTSRGDVVDTSAIPGAIESGQLKGAAIDVLKDEPPLEDNPLIKAWRDPQHPAYHRVIINPHAAFYSEQGIYYLRQRGAQICRNALLDLPVNTIVN